jgi:hypothetical protein
VDPVQRQHQMKWLLALALVGCSSTPAPSAPDLPPCSNARLAAMTAACSTLILIECKPNDTECVTYMQCEDRLDRFERECVK